MLPREALLQGSRDPEALVPLITLAEEALRTWEPVWSGFVAADLREEAQQRLGALSELSLGSEGGWPGAERRCLLLQRAELAAVGDSPAAPPLTGLIVSGNFLFDPAEPDDMRRGLLAAGAQASDLGDIWLRGDRGAQLVLTAAAAERLHGRSGLVRTVEVTLERVPLEQLQLPTLRSPREVNSVEASLRLDAVASAGFGLSRNRMAELIRSGAVRVNWQPVQSPSRELACGDRVRLEGKGELEVLEVQPTKRERWRLRLLRR
jgi:photosystem II S4 domain protein